MNLEVKKKWVDALRSGQYKQTKHFLHDTHGYCCLGVLCDIYAKENNHRWGTFTDDHYPFMGERGRTPKEVLEWAGIKNIHPTHHNPIVKVKSEKGESTMSLSELNDVYEGTFPEIADLIEQQL